MDKKEYSEVLNQSFVPKYKRSFPSIVNYLDRAEKIKIFKGECVNDYVNHSGWAFVERGSFDAFIKKVNGMEVYIAKWEEGGMINWLEKNDDKNILYARALENSIIYVFSMEDFYDIAYSNLNVLREFQNMQQEIIRLLANRMIHVSNYSAMGKILTYINGFLGDIKPNEKGEYIVPFEMTQKDLSDFLFIHISTCNRIFVKLREDSVLEKNRRFIIIKNYNKFIEYMEDEIFI